MRPSTAIRTHLAMPNIPPGMRECPTRADGVEALFAHVIRVSACQELQRGFYHKCPTCRHYNARVGTAPSRNGSARESKAAPEPRLSERIEARRAASGG